MENKTDFDNYAGCPQRAARDKKRVGYLFILRRRRRVFIRDLKQRR